MIWKILSADSKPGNRINKTSTIATQRLKLQATQTLLNVPTTSHLTGPMLSMVQSLEPTKLTSMTASKLFRVYILMMKNSMWMVTEFRLCLP